MLDTPTYLLIVIVGGLITLVVGQILMRSGLGFLREVFDDDEDAAVSANRLLGVLFHLIALGFLALISTYRPFDVEGRVQLVVTQLGGVMLLLGVLHGLALLLLTRIRSKRRNESIESAMTSQYEQQRRARQSRQQVIEGGPSSGT